MTKPTNPFDASAQPMKASHAHKRDALTAEDLRKVLSYDAETGLFHWLITTTWRTPAGSVAGSLKKESGYVVIGVNCLLYRAHRLAWLYTYGKWPSAQVDHINGVKDDNRIANLREVSNFENQQNLRAPHSDNVTGLLGVSRNHKGFRARIKFDGKLMHLGTFKTPELAYAAYIAAKRKHHLPGAFSEASV